ncbi:uncharacterized protein LOC125454593 [Stegostoma tigrinum]|uniref:uncharacterized protein LOC125454593 n=1 Tax=Stegostoma tigrinum TaxID=3053191 RepID=UPI00286FFE7E|nr:uncharacterized protein LOC125454593 [Stegostoma tigrinum]
MFGQAFSTLTSILCLAVGRVDTQTTLLQFPEAVTVTEGGTVTFRCDLRSSNADSTVNRYDLHWHHSRGGLKILSHYVNGRVYRSRGFSERFQLPRNVTSNSYILTIRDLKLTDSNTYNCEIWGKIYGNGTRLNVTIANPPILLQPPSLERVTEGRVARLQCTVRNAAVTRTDVHWYWEQPGNNMEWILTHDVRNITRWSPGFTERFQSSRDSSNNSFILTITNMQPNDTGVYYCKVWGDISGKGTQLTVTEEPSHDTPQTSDPILITGTILGLAVLICLVLLIVFLRKQKLCSSVKDSTQGSPGEDQNAVYETVNDSLAETGDQHLPGAYRVPPSTGHQRNVKDSPADSESTYMTLQLQDCSTYSELKGRTAAFTLLCVLSERKHKGTSFDWSPGMIELFKLEKMTFETSLKMKKIT